MDLKVAIGTWEAPPILGGPAYYIKELVERLAKHIHIDLIVPKYAIMKAQDGLIPHRISSPDIPIIRVCLFAGRASLLLKKLNVDIVHDNGILGFSNFSPFIETWHHGIAANRGYNSASLYFLSYYREIITLMGMKKASSVIAISQAAKTELVENYKIESSKIFVIPHGVDTDFFRPSSISIVKNYSRPRGVTNLLYVGSLSSRKNLDSLIYAIKMIQSKRKNIHLLIVGSGEKKLYLQQLVKKLYLDDSIHFFGSLSRPDLLSIYNLTDFVIVPSFQEGFGMTMLEALACEKPVVTTPVGISDMIKKNNLGIVADGFTPLQLSKAIQLALDIEKFSGLRSFVEKNFSWSKTVDATLNVYKRTLDSNESN